MNPTTRCSVGTGPINEFVFSPCGANLALGSGKCVRLAARFPREATPGEGGAASVAEQAAEVVAAMDEEEEHVYLIVHNIDGATLRNEWSQDVLAQLAAP